MLSCGTFGLGRIRISHLSFLSSTACIVCIVFSLRTSSGRSRFQPAFGISINIGIGIVTRPQAAVPLSCRPLFCLSTCAVDALVSRLCSTPPLSAPPPSKLHVPPHCIYPLSARTAENETNRPSPNRPSSNSAKLDVSQLSARRVPLLGGDDVKPVGLLVGRERRGGLGRDGR